MTLSVWERERERQRETDRQTYRQTDRHTDRQTDRHTDRQTGTNSKGKPLTTTDKVLEAWIVLQNDTKYSFSDFPTDGFFKRQDRWMTDFLYQQYSWPLPHPISGRGSISRFGTSILDRELCCRHRATLRRHVGVALRNVMATPGTQNQYVLFERWVAHPGGWTPKYPRTPKNISHLGSAKMAAPRTSMVWLKEAPLGVASVVSVTKK